MLIMVFDVPAEYGGALSILEEYYNRAKLDKNNNWIFIVSKPNLLSTSNVKIFRYPWVKKSWLHRVYFELLVAPKIVKSMKPERILSLHNLLVLFTKGVDQTVYVHQSIPFSEYRFKMFKDWKLWTYQNIIGKMIKASIINADHVIVQTQWMKNECIEATKINPQKIKVENPCSEIISLGQYSSSPDSNKTFFYPAGGSKYKNHQLIIDACKELHLRGITNYKVVLTLSENDSMITKKYYKQVEDYKLNFEFLGHMSKEDVFNWYTKSVLLFPSYIESSPLPLSEAKAHGTPIISTKCAFSKEILESYPNAYFFNYYDSLHLADLMQKCIELKLQNGIKV